MKTKQTILILEDNEERIAAFQRAVAALGDDYELRLWRDVPSMRAECEACFPNAGFLTLQRDVLDRLYRYKVRSGLPTWERAIEALLERTP